MPQERTNRALDEWRAIAHSARRPADPPRPGATSSQLLSVVGTAVAAVAVVAVLVLAGRPPQGPATPSAAAIGSAAVPSASASQPATPSSAPVTMASPTNGPSPMQSPTGPSPSQGPARAALTPAEAAAVVTAYTQELVAGQYAKAWGRLGDASKSGYGSLAAYTSERSAYFASVKGRYRVEVSPPGLASIDTWLTAIPGGGAGIDPAGSVLVEVTYPLIEPSNQFDVYIVARVGGSVLIFIAR